MDPNNNDTAQPPRALSARTQQDHVRSWRRWGRHCAELAELRLEGIDPLDAPFWAFEALFTTRAKSDQPLSVSAIRKITQAVTRRSGDVVPAHKRPEDAAQWRMLLLAKARREGPRQRRLVLDLRRDGRLGLAGMQRITDPDLLALLSYDRRMKTGRPSPTQRRQTMGHHDPVLQRRRPRGRQPVGRYRSIPPPDEARATTVVRASVVRARCGRHEASRRPVSLVR
jgi:hypothetical protein